jgi:transposase
MEPRAAHSRVGGRRDQQELVINQAEQLLATITATNVVQRQPLELADELLDEIRGLDERLARSRRRISVSDAVTTSGTSLTEIFGVDPVVAARIMDYSGDPTRFPTASHVRPTTAPPRSSSPPPDAPCTTYRDAANAPETTPST